MAHTDAALAVIEAAYASLPDERAWLDGMLRALEGFGLGETCGYTFHADARGVPRVDVYANYPMTIERFYAVPDAVLRHCNVPAPRVEHSWAREARLERDLGMRRGQLVDLVGVRVPAFFGALGSNTGGTEGVLLGIKTERELSARVQRRLLQIGVHVEAAYRLRARVGLQRTAVDPNRAAAVLDSEGSLLHATPEALPHRASLALAAKNADSALRRSKNVDPDRALELWAALVSGRWSIVDHVESDGRRYLLAVENPPNANLLGLTDREAHVAAYAALGHSQKHIAYELGLQPSMVSKHLAGALRKWGLSNRAELIRAFGPLARLTQALRATAKGPGARNLGVGPGPTPGE